MNPSWHFRNILAATDLSESSLPALRCARTFAERLEANLTVMYTDPQIYPLDLIGRSPALHVTPTEAELKRLREAVGKHAAAIMKGCRYDIEVSAGQPVFAILDVARQREADLIVVGTHLRHGWRRALLGSVSAAVIHGSECPVLTVARSDQQGGVHTILCPVNFTETARESLRVAAELASEFRSRLLIVHVVEPADVANASEDERRLRSWIASDLQDMTSFRQIVVSGGASERVLDSAEEYKADLLVIGAQHKTFRDSTVIGTTSERLIRFASCPVLVVPRSAKAVEMKEELLCSSRTS